MNARALLWVLPLMAAATGYFLKTAWPVKTKDPIGAVTVQVEEKSVAQVTDLGELHEGLYSIKHDLPFANSDEAELKRYILVLSEKYAPLAKKVYGVGGIGMTSSFKPEEREIITTTRRLGDRLGAAISMLAKNGNSNLEWVRENSPQDLDLYCSIWAGFDPKGVWDMILSSKEGVRPCAMRTMLGVIFQLSDNDPTVFLSMVEAAPWKSFSQDLGDEIDVGGADKLDLWIKSGAARYLTEKGVLISRFYDTWAAKDPDAAIAAWKAWSEPSSEISARALRGILRSDLDFMNIPGKLDAFITGQSEETLAHMKATYKAATARDVYFFMDAEQFSPLLKSWSPLPPSKR